MNRWKFLAIYIPAAIGCWAIGHVAGVKNGTGGSVAVGYGGGLAVTVVVLVWWWRRRRPVFAPQEDTADIWPTEFYVPSWPYEVLGLSYGAADVDVKRAYRALAQHFHPDHNPGDLSAAERFSAVQAAYEELGKP